MKTEVLGVFVGKASFIGDEGHASAIIKSPVAGSVRITTEGLVGDEQADRRVHGGSEKAVHHFARATYDRLREAFPNAEALMPGGLGENLSTAKMDETTVCIGDVYRVGSALLQVSQPRRPCWKINERTGIKGVSLWVQEQGVTGWYYRVLQEGNVTVGDQMTLEARDANTMSIADLWNIYGPHQPDLDAMARLAQLPSLNAEWRRNVSNRIQWWRRRLESHS